MKIHSPIPGSSPTVSTVSGSRLDNVAGSGAATAPGAAAPGAAPAAKGSVDLSVAARHLATLPGGDGDINVDRINEIRDAIASGELKIDPGRVADELIASVRDLLK